MTEEARANHTYGSLTEGLHLVGYSFERACSNLEWLLEGNRWKTVGSGFEDVNSFLASLKIDALRLAVDSRKRIAQRIKELQPDVSNRQIAKTLGVHHDTIDRDLGGNPPSAEKNANDIKANNKPVGGNPPLSGAKAAEIVLSAEKKELHRQERKAEISALAPLLDAHRAQFDLYNEACLKALNSDPCTVDWVITDPPYPKEFLEVYDDLGRVAAHVLKPGGSLLCMIGQSYLPAIVEVLSRHLTYHWTMAYLTPGGQATQIFPRKINTFWKPILWFVKDDYAGAWIGDVARSSPNDNDKRFHEWGQSESGMHDLMVRFVKSGDCVLDPFMGGGTTGVIALKLGARFFGFDGDKDAFNEAVVRLDHAELVS